MNSQSTQHTHNTVHLLPFIAIHVLYRSTLVLAALQQKPDTRRHNISSEAHRHSDKVSSMSDHSQNMFKTLTY